MKSQSKYLLSTGAFEPFAHRLLLAQIKPTSARIASIVKPPQSSQFAPKIRGVAMGFLRAVARNFDTFAGPVVMLLYPLYASIRAIESPSQLDDQQWLTYWVLYSFIALFELSFSKILAWLPFWPYLKLIVSCWLVLPMFNGAAYIYENFVRGLVLNPDHPSSRLTQGQKRVLRLMSPEARSAVERFIEKHGQQAFDAVIKAAEKEAKKNKGHKTGADSD